MEIWRGSEKMKDYNEDKITTTRNLNKKKFKLQGERLREDCALPLLCKYLLSWMFFIACILEVSVA
jgi:hypothetical protein